MVRQLNAPLSIPAVLPHGPMQEQTFIFDSLVENARSLDQNYSSLAEHTTKMLQQLQDNAPSNAETARQSGKVAQWEEGPRFI